MWHQIEATESTPPLYYCMAWVWARIFGYGETGLRSLSAVAGVLTVPLEALRVGDGPPNVMVVRNNAVEALPVRLGAADQKDIEIVTGIAERDQVILQGKDLVRPGQKVRTVPASTGQ